MGSGEGREGARRAGQRHQMLGGCSGARAPQRGRASQRAHCPALASHPRPHAPLGALGGRQGGPGSPGGLGGRPSAAGDWIPRPPSTARRHPASPPRCQHRLRHEFHLAGPHCRRTCTVARACTRRRARALLYATQAPAAAPPQWIGARVQGPRRRELGGQRSACAPPAHLRQPRHAIAPLFTLPDWLLTSTRRGAGLSE